MCVCWGCSEQWELGKRGPGRRWDGSYNEGMGRDTLAKTKLPFEPHFLEKIPHSLLKKKKKEQKQNKTKTK